MLNISDVKSVWKHDSCSYFPSTLVTEKEYTLDTFTQILTLYLQLRSWDWVLLKELFHIANDSEHQFHASVEKIVHSFYHRYSTTYSICMTLSNYCFHSIVK